MRYLLERQGARLALYCTNGGLGSLGWRRILGSEHIDPISLLDMMESRGHLNYKLTIDHEPVSMKAWDRFVDSDEYDPERVGVHIESNLDVMTLAGFCAVAIDRPGSRGPDRVSMKYAKPRSRKAVQNSWLYQNGTELVGA